MPDADQNPSAVSSGGDREHIFAQTPESLSRWCETNRVPGYRAKQILDWVYAKGVIDPGQMSNLSASDRERLADGFTFLSGRTVRHQVASDGTQKLLIQWEPGRRGGAEAGGGEGVRLPVLGAGVGGGEGDDPSRQTECVLIPTEARQTACISSQIGCPVGCTFCASGLGGLEGNLSAGRIVEQVWRLRSLIPRPAGGAGKPGALPRISNVVFMGMGEPLANFSNVTSAIRTLASPWGMGISARKITISTVGLPAAIDRLAAQFELPVTLALSLHAPTDEIRRRLIPWAQYSTIEELLRSCQRWFEKTGREITLEYTLLRGVNDRPSHARALAEIASTVRANINLIRYNEVEGMPFGRPADEDVRAFQAVLKERGINAHIRASRGRDISAACGQLRHETGPKAPPHPPHLSHPSPHPSPRSPRQAPHHDSSPTGTAAVPPPPPPGPLASAEAGGEEP
ncbi:MAG: 23S rRNA (adenine(2503)-C(2))-methyltransferase RlmN [Phycisphaeraceae bacterium]|nr:MAG: 23S rRNA (adenine(2503)-C(2))-methyltransferase RlmN [Phycisphaeraceae bacterium]